MMERPATQSVSEPVDPGRDGHRWSVAGTGVGPEMAREMKLKTVTSVWECSTSAPVQGNACHKLPHQITLHCQDWKPSASEQRLKRKGGLLARPTLKLRELLSNLYMFPPI